ncbi:hypothetical protein E2P81_ATG10075 [Venturia nashicola]|nr:hypothetical protein E2P81_ATG10075 [Venturia nashicola]
MSLLRVLALTRQDVAVSPAQCWQALDTKIGTKPLVGINHITSCRSAYQPMTNTNENVETRPSRGRKSEVSLYEEWDLKYVDNDVHS